MNRVFKTLSGIFCAITILAGIISESAWAKPPAPYELQPYDSAHYQDLQVGRDGKPTELRPKEIYGTAPQIGIRLANGGAGYTGLLRALSEAYLAKHPTIHGKPFSIAWYATNTTYSFRALKDHVVDIALVYEISPEALTGKQAYAQRMSPLFRDAFILIGPEENPANLLADSPQAAGDSVDTMLEKIIKKGCKTPFASGCAMYLSRSDLSGTYKKETTYLIAHRTPQDLIQNSQWYYPHPSTPREALKEAQQKRLYGMNDRSTWLSQPALQQGLKIFADGSLGYDKNLLNPCYGLLAKPDYVQSNQPREFLKWLTSAEGQRIIARYGQVQFGAAIVKPWK